MNKKIIISVILLTVFLSCPAISAADSDCANETVATDEEITLDESPNELTANNEFKTFTQLKNEIYNKSEVDLDSDYVYTPEDDAGGIDIDKTLTINGHGFTINSTNASKLFNVKSNGNLTLNDVILLSDYADSQRKGSGFNNLGNVILNNVTFITTQNRIDDISSLSASIYNAGTLSIANSKFINSTVTTNRQSYFGLIDNVGTLKIEDTLFDNNFLNESCSKDKIYATNLIYNGGNLTLNRVTVTNNIMKTPTEIYGLIKSVNSNSIILINNSHFENNSVQSSSDKVVGTILYAERNAGTLTITNSKFIKTTGARGGGVIYSIIPNTLINNTFENNTASENGGVIYSQELSSYINNTFKGNSARLGGAIYTTEDLQPNSDLLFTGNKFIDNKATKQGGAIYSEGSIGTTILPVENNTFINNQASEMGGAIFLRGSWQSKTITAKKTLFQDNWAPDGSAIYNYMVTGPYISNVTYSIFEGNYGRVINTGSGSSAEYNYWGTNAPEFNTITKTFTPTNIITISIEGNETLQNRGEYSVNFRTNATNEIAKSMPDYTVDLKSKLKADIPKSVTIREGEAVFIYSVEKTGNETIKVMKNDEEITHIDINIISAFKKPVFSITANDVQYGQKLDFKFTVTEGPEGSDIYNWTIIDKDKKVLESGYVTENNEINYKNNYSEGNYTITVRISNVDGWQDLEMSDGFEIRKADNGTGPNNNETNTNTTPDQPNDNKTATVKKPTKITAKNKKFKAKTKIKKYAVTLKAGKNPVKKVQLTIKIGKKTYKAKTNSKGKAVFKIKKLTKKGKYKAVIKFKGNKNYKASSKKVKITVK